MRFIGGDMIATFLLAAFLSMQDAAPPTVSPDGVIGPEELRDFTLEEPAPRQPRQSQPQPPQTQPAPQPRDAAPRRAPQSPPPQSSPVAPASPPRAPVIQPTTSDDSAAPEIARPGLSDEALAPPPQSRAPRAAAPAELPGRAVDDEIDWEPYLWGGLALVLLLGWLAWGRRKRVRLTDDDDIRTAAPAKSLGESGAAAPADRAKPAATPAVAAMPAMAAMPASPDQNVTIRAKPNLRMDLQPVRAVFDEDRFAVDYKLDLSNLGSAPARGLRVDVGLLTAGSDLQERIDAFIADHRGDKSPPLPELPPQRAVPLGGTAQLKRDDIRVMMVEGRQLLFPVILFVVRQVSLGGPQRDLAHAAWLIGRKGEEKMAPLRTDKGYRQWRDLDARRQ